MTPPSDSDRAHPDMSDWLDEEDIEYEVEPPDEHATQAKEQLKQQAVKEATERAAVDENWYHAQPWEADFRWQFSIRDLMIFMGVLAIAMTAFRYTGACGAFVFASIAMFFWILVYMERLDPTVPQPDTPQRTNSATSVRRSLPPLRITYSTADLLIAMTISAVGFSLLNLLPAAIAAAALGFLVLAGIVLYWLGTTIYRRAVLAWVILTVMYLVVSFIAIIQKV